MCSGTPAGARRLSRKSVTRHGRDDNVERILRLATMCGRIGEQSDELDLLEHGAWPAVVDDERKSPGILGTDVDEMNVQPINVGNELRQSIQFRFRLPPVVISRPIPCELLHLCEGYALGRIGDGFLLRPLRCEDPATKLGDILSRAGEPAHRGGGGARAATRRRPTRFHSAVAASPGSGFRSRAALVVGRLWGKKNQTNSRSTKASCILDVQVTHGVAFPQRAR